MKKSLFLYLFVFAVIINLFTYMYFTGQQKHEEERILKLQEKVTSVRDSLASNPTVSDDFFTLSGDAENAADLDNADLEALEIKVRDAIYAKNAGEKGNSLVQYPSMGGRPFTIGKYKVLNSHWVIAEFSNGNQSGQVLLKYFIEEDGSVTFETGQTFLHTVVAY